MRVGSLCQGIGGADLALEAHGHTVAWGAELDPAPASVCAHHWPDVPNHGDITTIDWDAVEPVDILSAGYPCQPFSTAGRRQGTNDDRHLWPAVRHAVASLRPRYVFLENVRGHLSLGAAIVVADLAALGYVSTWGLLGSSDVGGCHRRIRWWLVATDPDGGGRGPVVAAVRERQPDTPRRRDLTLLPTPTARDHKGRNQRSDSTCLPGAVDLLPTPTAWLGRRPANGDGDAARWADPERSRELSDCMAAQSGAFGRYAAAVERWAVLLGVEPPAPTDDKNRLAPAFVEWMMGYPAGWITDLDLTRTAQLKALGNAQQPQVAYQAWRLLTGRLESEAVAA